jgi:tetratricopeptide (TPR) repeat protein
LENNAAQPGKPVDPNETLARLQQLEEEARRLREQLQATPASSPGDPDGEITAQIGQAAPSEPIAEPSPPVEVTSEDPEPALQPFTEEQKEEADKLLQRYRLEKQRGNKDFALRYLTEAVELAPGYTYVLECQADEAEASRKIEEAKRLYKTAMAADPKNHSAEAKHADLVFRSQAAASTAVLQASEVTASARTATLLTAIVPGLGQLVTGQIIKGGVILALWIALLCFMPVSLPAFTALVSQRGSVQALPLMALLGSFVLWLGALIDMQSFAKSSAARAAFMGISEAKKERPLPPEEGRHLPFEIDEKKM